MGTFFSEMAWLCLAVTAVLGGTILWRLNKSQGQVGKKVVCLAGLWGGACLLSLPLFWGLFLFSLSCFIMYTYFSGQEFLPVDQKAILITGSDSGFGHALSKYLDKLGFTVFAGVLNEGGPGAEELRRTCSMRLSVLQLDITKPQQIKDAHSKVMEKVQNRGSHTCLCTRITWRARYTAVLSFNNNFGSPVSDPAGLKWGSRCCISNKFPVDADVAGSGTHLKNRWSKPCQAQGTQKICFRSVWLNTPRILSPWLLRGLWAVVNNAGIFSYPADGELTPMTEYKRCMAVNFFGTVEVTKAFLPLLRKSKGRLVNISSLAGAIPMERLAAYSSSKAALTMFSAVLRQELSNWGVKVSVIQPGGFQTNITGTSDMWDKLEKSILDHLPPDVQEDYGQDYIHRQRGYLRLINNFSDPNISPVLLDIHHAISAKSPCAFYAPGKMTYPWIYFVSFSPTGIFDYFAKKKHGHGKIMPRALSKPNVKNEAI